MVPGTHEVKMTFFPSGMPLGILLSAAGIGLVVVFIMTDGKKKFKSVRPARKEAAPAAG